MNMTHTAHNEPKLHWKWVLFSVVAGLIVVGASYFIVAPAFQSVGIQALVMLVGFIITGVIIGYFSPGITINEASLGGALVMLVMLWVIYLSKVEIQFSILINLLLLIFGVVFSWVGGWAGEKLQGDKDSEGEAHEKKFLWKWVLVGVIIGFALNVLFVFILSRLFLVYAMKVAFIGFILSFLATGFIVGLKSPGVTLREASVAGLLAVILDWLFLKFVLTLSVQALYLVIGLLLGLFLSFFGAWFGEKYQQSLQQKKQA
jgi:hypothetical protein